jgi:hypothetical protein
VVHEDDVGVLRDELQLLALAGAEKADWSNWARFCMKVPTTSMPSVLASWRNSVS